jgi:hypothetical protein
LNREALIKHFLLHETDYLSGVLAIHFEREGKQSKFYLTDRIELDLHVLLGVDLKHSGSGAVMEDKGNIGSCDLACRVEFLSKPFFGLISKDFIQEQSAHLKE